MHAVQVDERHRLARLVLVDDAGAKRPGHEGEVRVGVGRFDRPLIFAELGPPLHLVVLVARALREHRPEHFDVGHDAGTALIQPRGDARVEITGRGVEGATERARVRREGIAEPLRERALHVDDVDAGPRNELERQL